MSTNESKQLWCLKEKKKVDVKNVQEITAKNGRKMLKAECVNCGCKCSQFVKKNSNDPSPSKIEKKEKPKKEKSPKKEKVKKEKSPKKEKVKKEKSPKKKLEEILTEKKPLEKNID